MKSRCCIALVGLCFSLTACAAGLRGGPMAKFNGATSDFGDTHGSGFTLGANAELALVAFSVVGEAGWSRFSGEELDGVEYDDASFFEASFGGRVLLGPVFIGAQYGYATSDLDQNLLRPEVGMRLGPLSAFAQYQMVNDKWWSIGGSFSFF